MQGVYKSIREYANIKNISWQKAKRQLKKGELIQEEIKGKRIIINIKEMIKYLITKL